MKSPLLLTAATLLLGSDAFQTPPPSFSRSSSNVMGDSSAVRAPLQAQSHDDDLPTTTTAAATTTSQRRGFLTSVIATSAALATGTTSFSPPADAATAGMLPDMVGGFVKVKGIGGLTKKIRSVGNVMDELQRDLMQERWDLVGGYPEQLRSYVPVFTTFTDTAYSTDSETDVGLRVALRYEVGRFFASVERLKQATSRKSLDQAYLAYADMSLHFDRFLRVGGLYTYYDAIISNEDFYKGIAKDQLVYSDPVKDPVGVRDLIVLISGSDMGKTGIVIGMYKDGSDKCVVKFDRYKGSREVKVEPLASVAKRLGEQIPDDAFLIPRKE